MFEFVPLWNIAVFFAYALRRVNCPRCGVKVESVPWADGKNTLTKTYMQFLAAWAKKLSWKETAVAFRTTWEKVFRSVEWAVQWGLAHRDLSNVQSIGVDEVLWQRGHKYLTVVYQIDTECKRLLWVGKDRTIKTLLRFFRTFGKERSAQLLFICSDMWKPYLKVIAKKASQAIHVLDRFHIAMHMNKAIDEVRAQETRELKAKGLTPILTHSRWCLAQTAGESDVQPGNQTQRSPALQPEGGAQLLAEGRLSILLGLCLSLLGRRVSRSLVQARDALPHRTHEEGGAHAAVSQRAFAQLVSGQKDYFQRRHRGFQ